MHARIAARAEALDPVSANLSLHACEGCDAWSAAFTSRALSPWKTSRSSCRSSWSSSARTLPASPTSSTPSRCLRVPGPSARSPMPWPIRSEASPRRRSRFRAGGFPSSSVSRLPPSCWKPISSSRRRRRGRAATVPAGTSASRSTQTPEPYRSRTSVWSALERSGNPRSCRGSPWRTAACWFRRAGGGGRPAHEPLGGNHTLLSDARLSGSSYPIFELVRDELRAWRTYYLDPGGRMRASATPREVRDIGAQGEHIAPFLYGLKARRPSVFDAVRRALGSVIPTVTDLDVDFDTKRGTLDIQVRHRRHLERFGSHRLRRAGERRCASAA